MERGLLMFLRERWLRPPVTRLEREECLAAMRKPDGNITVFHGCCWSGDERIRCDMTSLVRFHQRRRSVRRRLDGKKIGSYTEDITNM